MGVVTTFLLVLGMGQAQLRIDPAVVELKTIVAGPTIPVRVELANTGAAPLEIVEVNRSCGCLAPRLASKMLAPGAKTTLQLDLRTLGHLDGQHSWSAAIVYKQGGQQLQQSLGIRAIIKNDVVVQPASLALHVLNRLEQEVRLHDRRDPPLTVKAARCTQANLKVEVRQEKPGHYRIAVLAQAADLPPGRQDGFLDIYTDDPQYAHLQVPLTLTKLNRPEVTATPETLRLRAGQSSAPLRLRSRQDQPLVIDKVESPHPGLTCAWAVGADGNAVLRAKARPDLPPGTYALRVLLLQPVQQEMRIETFVLANQ